MDLIIRWYLTITAFLAQLVTPQPRLAVARARRGAGFLEYMMVATVALAVFVAIKALFPGLVSGILNTITSAIK